MTNAIREVAKLVDAEPEPPAPIQVPERIAGERPDHPQVNADVERHGQSSKRFDDRGLENLVVTQRNQLRELILSAAERAIERQPVAPPADVRRDGGPS
jgi:hypothetical protein